MRDRLTELLPLLLVGIVLLAFQLTRADSPILSFLPVAAAPVDSRPPTPQPEPHQVAIAGASVNGPRCLSTQPRFTGTVATLRSTIGSRMGDPLECEWTINPQGDTQQQTTTGLAYRRKKLNATCFTTGWEHWALRDDGRVVYWAGDAVDPPYDAFVISSR